MGELSEGGDKHRWGRLKDEYGVSWMSVAGQRS